MEALKRSMERILAKKKPTAATKEEKDGFVRLSTHSLARRPAPADVGLALCL
jgi:hypothetical protein